jgi:polysaccharide deacetylase 2 family uncharacterized protein YibQ
MAENAAPTRAQAASYRGLALFWAVVICLFGGTALTVQILGPVKPPAPPVGSAAPAFTPPPPPTSAAAAKAPLIPPPDPALQEAAADYPGRFLPISAGGRAPRTVYAAPFDQADKHPRVALVISGAGLDQDATLHLLADLPPAIDVAFSAYMPEALEQQFAARARQTGHECLESIPMEPASYPLAEEGARSLLTGGESEQNRQNLEWALSRLTGCAGATGASDGMMGERYAQNASGFNQVLADITGRGLLYVDPRTGAPALETADPTTFRVVDMIVDQTPNPDEVVTADIIDQRLATLEHLAAVRGAAIGLAGPPKPVLLERIAVWSRGLAARGITLAPVTAIPPVAR